MAPDSIFFFIIFRTVSYQIPLSDWLTSGPYETVTTYRCFMQDDVTLDAKNMLTNFVCFVAFEINMLLVFTQVTSLYGH